MKNDTNILLNRLSPKTCYDHDWFRCTHCGYAERKLVLGNHSKCPECGGMMVRT